MAALLVGCSGGATTGGPGADLIKAGRYSEAVTQLQQSVATRPEDARLRRNLGVAQFKSGDAKSAAATLAEARKLDPRDDLTLFYLGQAAEAAGDYAAASDAYAAYVARHSGEAEVATRLREVNRKRLAADVQRALDQESRLAAPGANDNTLAVLEFKNFSSLNDLEPLGKGLTDMITSDLARVERFRVVERTQMSMLVDELKLTQSTVKVSAPKASSGLMTPRGMKERLAALQRKDGGRPYYEGPIDDTSDDALTEAIKVFQADRGLTVDGKFGPRTRNALGDAFDAWAARGTVQMPAVDQKTAPRLGKLLAARMLVQGGFSATGDASALQQAQLRIDAGITETVSGQPQGASADVTGPLSNLFGLEKELVYDLLHQAGIELTREERDALGRPPTRNVDAFLAYSRGLWEEDRGRLVEAREAYSRAVALDPGFARARAHLGGLSGTPQGFSSLDARLVDQLQVSTPTRSDASIGRLLAVGAINGGGLVPGAHGSDHLNPITPPVGAASGTGTVIVTGEVPR